MNQFLWSAIVCVVLALLGAAYLVYRQRKAPAATGAPSEPLGKVVSAAVASHVRTLGEEMRSHVDSWGSAIRTDIAKAAHHPAAPAAPIAADTPPSTVAAAASEPAAAPSAGANGTNEVSAKVAAKHAEYDAQIAALQAKKRELDEASTAATAAVDQLVNKLTEPT